MKRLDDLGEAELLALAIASEEEDARIYLTFAQKLRANYPHSARMFEEMAAEESGHRHQLLAQYESRFGTELPLITRQDVKGFLKRNPVWLHEDLQLEAARRHAAVMEVESSQFYARAAERAHDTATRKLLADLAEAERGHEKLAEQLDDELKSSGAADEEEETRKRLFVLQIVQPALAGLIDGSVSTLAPIFAAAFATHDSWNAFVVGLAASIGAGISMGLTEALSDDGVVTGRGHPGCAAPPAASPPPSAGSATPCPISSPISGWRRPSQASSSPANWWSSPGSATATWKRRSPRRSCRSSWVASPCWPSAS